MDQLLFGDQDDGDIVWLLLLDVGPTLPVSVMQPLYILYKSIVICFVLPLCPLPPTPLFFVLYLYGQMILLCNEHGVLCSWSLSRSVKSAQARISAEALHPQQYSASLYTAFLITLGICDKTPTYCNAVIGGHTQICFLWSLYSFYVFQKADRRGQCKFWSDEN